MKPFFHRQKVAFKKSNTNELNPKVVSKSQMNCDRAEKSSEVISVGGDARWKWFQDTRLLRCFLKR